MKVTLPPCPCPICGHIHGIFTAGSLRTLRGKGYITPATPTGLPYKLNMTEADIDSAIYGPMWKSLDPSVGCRQMTPAEVKAAHGGLGEFHRASKRPGYLR